MDNFVQNINIEEIIPNEYKEIDENTVEFNQLMNSIQRYGIIEPLLVRPNNGKYEILLGNKRFFIAKKLGLQTVPALVRNIDEELYKEYKEINNINQKNKQNKFINSNISNEQNNSPHQNKFINVNVKKEQNTNSEQNKFINPNIKEENIQKKRSKNKEKDNEKKNNYEEELIVPISNFNSYDKKQSDIVNIEELNKKEYNERDEIDMNNTLESQMIQPQNLSTNQGQVPTFGGKFFPSLEDEPTNMNMGQINIASQNFSAQQPIMNPQDNNNLIDLTDVNGEKEIQQPQNITPQQEIPQTSTFEEPIMATPNIPNIVQQMPTPIMPATPQQAPAIVSQDFAPQEATPAQPQPELNANPNIEQSMNNMPDMNQTEAITPMINVATESNLQMPNIENNNMMNMDTNPQVSIPQSINPIDNTQINNPTSSTPQFDMSQNIAQNITPKEIPTPETQTLEMQNMQSQIPQNDFETPMNKPEMYNYQQNMPNIPIDNNNIEVENNQQEQVPESPLSETNNAVQDITPVTDTIKNLAINLQKFGYKINVTEEDLPTSSKVIIEIEK